MVPDDSSTEESPHRVVLFEQMSSEQLEKRSSVSLSFFLELSLFFGKKRNSLSKGPLLARRSERERVVVVVNSQSYNSIRLR